MKQNLLLIILFFLLLTNIYSQSNNKDSTNTSYYLTAGFGYKYQISHIDPLDYGRKYDVFQSNYHILLGVSADFYGTGKHIMGLELIGFPYVYGDHEMVPHNFSLLSLIYYRRNISVYKNFFVFPAIGVSFFSNDVNSILNLNFDFGLSYKFRNYDLFLKNSFRISPNLLHNTPWFLTAGTSINF
ncbi:MAG: hypothetical protein Q8933_13760 [Bacteroidota bacterium]|nr:hypothetical protein [Bacteroidota bacterium]MDP4197192.1 hypothetical protein [Bacteroidota bacterium]